MISLPNQFQDPFATDISNSQIAIEGELVSRRRVISVEFDLADSLRKIIENRTTESLLIAALMGRMLGWLTSKK